VRSELPEKETWECIVAKIRGMGYRNTGSTRKALSIPTSADWPMRY